MLLPPATTIVRWWKKYGSKKTLKTYTQAMQVNDLKTLSFEDLVHTLRSRRVVQAQGSIVNRFKSVMKIDTEINPRVISAVFMIVLHPDNVFERTGPLETLLIEKSTAMLTRYEAICSEPWRWDLVKEFHQPMMEYLETFQTWKAPDTERLKSRIERALLAIYQVRNEMPVVADVQINRLREKLGKMDFDRLQRFDQMRLTMAIPQ